MSADVGSCRQCHRSKLGMVENVGVAVEIASPSVSVQKLFLLSTVCWPQFCISDVGQCRTMFAVPFLSWAWSKIWGSR